jgi:opacity protein-like surface antigen
MKTKLSSLAAGVLLCTAGAIQAQGISAVQGLRFDVGYSLIKLATPPTSYDPVGIRVGISKTLFPGIDVEGMLGTGVQSGKNSVTPALTQDVGPFWGAYIKPGMAITPELGFFARLGFASTQIKNGDTYNGLSTGLGLNYALDRNMRAYADYTYYKSSDTFGISALTLGVNYGF